MEYQFCLQAAIKACLASDIPDAEKEENVTYLTNLPHPTAEEWALVLPKGSNALDADPLSYISIYQVLLNNGTFRPTAEKLEFVAALKKAATNAGAPPKFLDDCVKLHFLVEAESRYPSG